MTNLTSSTTPVATTQVVHLDFIALSATATADAVEDLIAEAAGLTQLASVQVAGVIRTATATREALEARTTEASAAPPQPTPSRVGTPPHAQSAGVPVSDFDLAFFFVLDGFTSLEPFGTDPRYIRFLQGKVARLLRGFAGADVALSAPFPDVQPFATCLALMAPEQTYDWEVRAALESWTRQAGDPPRAQPHLSREGGLNTPDASASPSLASQAALNAIGLAIGERQRYRGCVLSFTTTETTPERPADRRFESTLIAGHATRLQA
ncbi:MAG: hypothetical protein AB7P33_13395 [Dehalococcoidia bacterium]